MKTKEKKLDLLLISSIVFGTAVWPWLVFGLPLALVFSPSQWLVRILFGVSLNLPLTILLTAVDLVIAFLLCVVVVFPIIFYSFKNRDFCLYKEVEKN